MSYICILANRKGVAAAADSRLTFAPIPLHLDWGTKVFTAPEQHLIWTCCGLTMWGGVNYVALTASILRRKGISLEQKLDQISRRVSPALRFRHRFTRKNAVFTLLVGKATREAVQLESLDVANGTAKRHSWPEPAVIDAGWQARLRPALPEPASFREDTLEKLALRARKRVQWAIARDQTLHNTQPRHEQTVGGPVKWAVLGIPEV